MRPPPASLSLPSSGGFDAKLTSPTSPPPPLVGSGFDRDDTWGHRDLEPGRCSISSIALVLLKTGIVHHGPSSASAAAKRAGGRGAGGGQGDVTLDGAQMVTAQKLLLFWRKPARKCWWDGVELDVAVDVDDDEGKAAGAGETVKVWARRVWTLELNIVRSSFLRACEASTRALG